MLNIGVSIIFLVSLVLIIIGLQIWKKEKITLMHTYHYKNIKEEDKSKYCEEIGKNIISLGITCLLFGTLIFRELSKSKEIFLVVLFLIIFVLNFYRLSKIQKKYNGSIF